jgi:hypothetical protein
MSSLSSTLSPDDQLLAGPNIASNERISTSAGGATRSNDRNHRPPSAQWLQVPQPTHSLAPRASVGTAGLRLLHVPGSIVQRSSGTIHLSRTSMPYSRSSTPRASTSRQTQCDRVPLPPKHSKAWYIMRERICPYRTRLASRVMWARCRRKMQELHPELYRQRVRVRGPTLEEYARKLSLEKYPTSSNLVTSPAKQESRRVRFAAL